MGAKRKVQPQQPPYPAGGASFFKVMLGDFKRRLRVPPSFTRHIAGKAQRKFTLHSSISGRSWHVEVERVADELFFCNGWEKFLKDHLIETADFLVFRYDGNLGFNVHVYGSDGCMKERFAGDDYKGKLPMKTAAQMIVNPGKQLNTKCNKEFVVFGESEPHHRGRVPPMIIGSDKALEEALSFKPEHPYFVATWRKSRAYQMTIPSALVKEFDFGRREHTTLRDYLGRLWTIEITKKGDGRVIFASGWTKFCRENHLIEGDACVFEFIQEGDIIQTHIFKMEKGTGKVIKRCEHNLKGKRSISLRDPCGGRAWTLKAPMPRRRQNGSERGWPFLQREQPGRWRYMRLRVLPREVMQLKCSSFGFTNLST